jgi:hypothetical protein
MARICWIRLANLLDAGRDPAGGPRLAAVTGRCWPAAASLAGRDGAWTVPAICWMIAPT